MTRLGLIALFTILCFIKIQAQEINMEQTLDYINAKISPRCSIEVVKGILIGIYKDGGQVVREDQVNVKDLDINSIKYNATENIFSINCKGAPSKKCVSRELYNIGPGEVYRPYARISFETYLDQKSADGLKNAFTHMMRLVMEPKYKSSEPFE